MVEGIAIAPDHADFNAVANLKKDCAELANVAFNLNELFVKLRSSGHALDPSEDLKHELLGPLKTLGEPTLLAVLSCIGSKLLFLQDLSKFVFGCTHTFEEWLYQFFVVCHPVFVPIPFCSSSIHLVDLVNLML
jgi:hypothetical protein